MRAAILILLGEILPAVVVAQDAPPPQALATPPAPRPPANYAYQPDGRRDPFLSVFGAVTPPAVGVQRSGGPAGIAVDELSVRGIVQSRSRMIAMIQGPDNRTYVVNSGDQLLDGIIKTVTPQGLVILQEVNDPLSLVKQREVTKRLRSREDAKQ